MGAFIFFVSFVSAASLPPIQRAKYRLDFFWIFFWGGGEQTQGAPGPDGHKHGVDHAAYFLPSQGEEVLIAEVALYPLGGPGVEVLLEAVVHVGGGRSDDERVGAGGYGLGAAGGGERVGADDEVRGGGAVEGGKEGGRGGLHCGSSCLGREDGLGSFVEASLEYFVAPAVDDL